jgi:Fe-S-cluster containining protein
MPKLDSKRAGAARRVRVQNKTSAVPRKSRSLPVIAQSRSQPGQLPCLSCGLCCTYIAVEIDDPSTLRGATDILWYLYHHGVAVYFDGDEWMVQLETSCRHLQADNRCAIYETRPQICREFDETSCEVNAEELGTTFYTARDFLLYLEQHHKRIHSLVRKRYLPPDAMLNGNNAARQPLGPFGPRLEALRRLGGGAATR